jgi:hypothetical protein
MMWAGALIGLLGVPAGLLGNELALRVGPRITAMGVFALSAVVSLLFGFSAALPYEAILVLGMAAGFIAQGNYSNLTSGVAFGTCGAACLVGCAATVLLSPVARTLAAGLVLLSRKPLRSFEHSTWSDAAGFCRRGDSNLPRRARWISTMRASRTRGLEPTRPTWPRYSVMPTGSNPLKTTVSD